MKVKISPKVLKWILPITKRIKKFLKPKYFVFLWVGFGKTQLIWGSGDCPHVSYFLVQFICFELTYSWHEAYHQIFLLYFVFPYYEHPSSHKTYRKIWLNFKIESHRMNFILLLYICKSTVHNELDKRYYNVDSQSNIL